VSAQAEQSLYTILQILSVSFFEKTPILQLFSQGDSINSDDDDCNQLNLLI